jgi:hypothetical protein
MPKLTTNISPWFAKAFVDKPVNKNLYHRIVIPSSPNSEFTVSMSYGELMDGQEFVFGWDSVNLLGVCLKYANGFIDLTSNETESHVPPDTIVLVRPDRLTIVSSEVDG